MRASKRPEAAPARRQLSTLPKPGVTLWRSRSSPGIRDNRKGSAYSAEPFHHPTGWPAPAAGRTKRSVCVKGLVPCWCLGASGEEGGICWRERQDIDRMTRTRKWKLSRGGVSDKRTRATGLAKCFKFAVSNIARHGDTDVFPFPIENHILFDYPEDFIDILKDVHEDFSSSLTTILPRPRE